MPDSNHLFSISGCMFVSFRIHKTMSGGKGAPIFPSFIQVQIGKLHSSTDWTACSRRPLLDHQTNEGNSYHVFSLLAEPSCSSDRSEPVFLGRTTPSLGIPGEAAQKSYESYLPSSIALRKKGASDWTGKQQHISQCQENLPKPGVHEVQPTNPA